LVRLSYEKYKFELEKNKIKQKDDQIYLFFMHHRPNICDENTALLTEHGGNGTLVSFTGHVHPASKYDVTWHPGKNGKGFYELNLTHKEKYVKKGIFQ